ncbi:hypothetical protein BDW66DRAFT_151534 [Aspergillus desertorum]
MQPPPGTTTASPMRSRKPDARPLSTGRKCLILFIVSWNTLVVTFLSTSLFVATPEIASDLVTTPEILNITNAGVLIAMGCSSLIWSPLADIFSRKRAYDAATGQFGGLALPVILAFSIGAGLMGAWNGLNTYSAEVIPSQRAEAVCSKYILQYIFGATATAAVVPLIDAIGIGWSFTIFAFLKLIGGGLLLVIARFAPDTGIWAYE